jgi:hypothetical protein
MKVTTCRSARNMSPAATTAGFYAIIAENITIEEQDNDHMSLTIQIRHRLRPSYIALQRHTIMR